MFKPYVQDVSDWIDYYERGGVSKQDSGEGTGGVGAESGSTANPVEKPVRNNNKRIETEMRQGQLSSMPGQEVVQQTLASTLRRRRKRKSTHRGKFIKKRKMSRKKKKKKKKRKKRGVKRRNGKKRKLHKRKRMKTKSSSRRRKSKKQRDLFAE